MEVRLFLIILLLGNVQSVSAASIEIPPKITAYLRNENNAVTEDGLLPFSNPETAAFADYVLSNWRGILSNFDEIAPNAREQCLIVASTEPLPATDYVQFVDGLCDLRLAEKTTPQAVWTVLWAGMNKKGFLAYNYDRPEVSAAIDKLQVIMLKENPSQWAEFFKEMKSGQLKQNAIQEMKRNGDEMPETYDNTKKASYNSMLQRTAKTGIAPWARHLFQSPMATISRKNIWPWVGGGILLVVGFGFYVRGRK